MTEHLLTLDDYDSAAVGTVVDGGYLGEVSKITRTAWTSPRRPDFLTARNLSGRRGRVLVWGKR